MQERAGASVAFSHMSATAALSVLALLGFVGWQLVARFAPAPALVANAAGTEATSSAASSSRALQGIFAAIASTTGVSATTSDPVSQASAQAMAQVLGAYAGLQSQGTFDTTTATVVGQSIGSSISVPISYHSFTISDLTIATDTSYQGMLTYRASLQKSLKPLMANQVSEFQLFAQYIATKDPSYLTQLSTAAQNYRLAASSTLLVAVPTDATQYQLGILNAMEKFAATLDSMVSHAHDPLATTILLGDYNSAESDVLSSFNALAQYEKNKKS